MNEKLTRTILHIESKSNHDFNRVITVTIINAVITADCCKPCYDGGSLPTWVSTFQTRVGTFQMWVGTTGKGSA